MRLDPDAGVPVYASTRLIAYLGNKRALLPFLLSVFRELDAERPIERFLDPFAGSGAVSRLARSLGWAVMANDAEEYSRAVNEAWLGVSADELPGLFEREGGLARVLAALNALHPEREGRLPDCPCEGYIARHYAPANTAAADWRRERLFYTAENAVFIDRVRCAIEYLRPQDTRYAIASRNAHSGRGAGAERALLIGLLVYEAATHANTSGVFKAYHKGFGGHGRDALGRILSPMLLEPPLLWPGPPSEVGRGDAAAFCSGRAVDLCYLDPPYNQHQYGSNYHLLNTIAAWDHPEVSEERSPDGALLRAAGIPESWKSSRSAFCSRAGAGAAFRELCSSIDARTIVLSYNTEGFVSPAELVDIFSDRAEVSIRSVGYVKYRGGRQSASRLSRNSEMLFVARRRGLSSRSLPAAAGSSAQRFPAEAREELLLLEAGLRLSRALAAPFDPRSYNSLCASDGTLRFSWRGVEIELRSYHGLLIESGAAAEALAALDAEGKEALAELLEGAALKDNAASCAAAASLIESGISERRLQSLALRWLRKLAYRGYEAQFRRLSATLKAAVSKRPEELEKLGAGLGEIDALFEARLAGRSRYRPTSSRGS